MTNSKIKLVYWNYPNFGDALSPYIVNKLSGKDVIRKEHYGGFIYFCKRVIKTLLKCKFSELKHIHFPYEKCILGIGSILSWGNKYSKIWGSGFMNNTEVFNGGKIYALRGSYSAKKLQGMGYKVESIAYGDPALLLPLLYKPTTNKDFNIGIIPHWSEINYFKNKYGEKYKIIDLNTCKVENVINAIYSCNYILSTSLHGIIVAHAYGIPAIWIQKGNIGTDGIKFNDYFSAVGIKVYEPVKNYDILLSSSNYDIIKIFKNFEGKLLPNINLVYIYRELLNNAPFDIIDKYMSMITESKV